MRNYSTTNPEKGSNQIPMPNTIDSILTEIKNTAQLPAYFQQVLAEYEQEKDLGLLTRDELTAKLAKLKNCWKYYQADINAPEWKDASLLKERKRTTFRIFDPFPSINVSSYPLKYSDELQKEWAKLALLEQAVAILKDQRLMLQNHLKSIQEITSCEELDYYLNHYNENLLSANILISLRESQILLQKERIQYFSEENLSQRMTESDYLERFYTEIQRLNFENLFDLMEELGEMDEFLFFYGRFSKNQKRLGRSSISLDTYRLFNISIAFDLLMQLDRIPAPRTGLLNRLLGKVRSSFESARSIRLAAMMQSRVYTS